MRELSLNVMDIAQNSISAGAKLIRIEVAQDDVQDQLSITIADDGKGMSDEQVSRVIDPFYTTRTTRKVGLGIPLFKMEAEMTGGGFSVVSQLGKGTTVTACFVPSHVDMIPLGDINSTVLLLVTCNPDRDFIFHRTVNSRDFTLDTREIRTALGNEVALNAPDVVEWIKDYLQEQTDNLLRRETI